MLHPSYIRQVPTEAEANLEKRPVLIEHPSAQHARLALFSKRVIAIGEELTVHVVPAVTPAPSPVLSPATAMAAPRATGTLVEGGGMLV
jgi:hypothetical protein